MAGNPKLKPNERTKGESGESGEAAVAARWRECRCKIAGESVIGVNPGTRMVGMVRRILYRPRVRREEEETEEGPREREGEDDRARKGEERYCLYVRLSVLASSRSSVIAPARGEIGGRLQPKSIFPSSVSRICSSGTTDITDITDSESVTFRLPTPLDSVAAVPPVSRADAARPPF